MNEGLHHFWIIFFPYEDPLKLRVFVILAFSKFIRSTLYSR